MKNKILIIGLAAFLLISAAATAKDQTGTERLFETSQLDNVTNGTALTFSHSRRADPKIPIREITNGKIDVIRIASNDTEHAEVILTNGKQRRKLHHFPTDRGNPVFVTFLESSVSAVTYATKGSPFYIRNRFKDAFGSGGEVSEVEVTIDGTAQAATQVVYRPFDGDQNAARMGKAFEALAVTFVLSDAVPGRFVSMTADATLDDNEFFMEEIRFVDAKPIVD